MKEKKDIPIQKWNKTKINLASLSILSELGLWKNRVHQETEVSLKRAFSHTFIEFWNLWCKLV